MCSVSFIVNRQLYSIASPSWPTAMMLWWLLRHAGLPVRMWSHRKKNAPRLIC